MSYQNPNNENHIAVFGKDHESPNEIFCQVLDEFNLAFGTSVGTTAKANEDCIGIATLDYEIVFAIADGHWGYEASELAVSKASELINRNVRLPKDNEARARFYPLYEQVNTKLFQMAMEYPGSPTPETTFIVCHVRETLRGKYLYWSSFGDSYLLILRDGTLIQLNTLNPYWLGMLSKLSENSETGQLTVKYLSSQSHYVGVATGLESGIEKLQSGDIIFLCTDGLIGSDDKIPDEVAKVISDILGSNGSLERRIKDVIGMAISRGEKDNISCVIAQI